MYPAMQFVTEYTDLLEELDAILHPSLYPVIRNLYREDPHDMIAPHQCFPSRQAALGFVTRMLIDRSKALRLAASRELAASIFEG